MYKKFKHLASFWTGITDCVVNNGQLSWMA